MAQERNKVILGIAAVAASLTAFAQTPAPPTNPEPGITLTRLMDRPEVRVSRLELEPGATRRMHEHDDVRFHLFIVLAGTVQFSEGADKVTELKSGQAYFLKKGTRHGFKNTGAGPASALEVFIKDEAAAATLDLRHLFQGLSSTNP